MSLGAVGVGAGVGHGQDPWPGVLEVEVLVVELVAVDGLAAGAVVVREVTTLPHGMLKQREDKRMGKNGRNRYKKQKKIS